MTGLLASEVRRLTSRRMVRWVLLVSLVLVIVLVVIVALQSNLDSTKDEDVMTLGQIWLSKGAARALGSRRDNVIATISVLTYLLVIVIGASAVGAEYRAGTVGTTLTWEPRRIRLLTVRLAAAAIVGMAFFLIVQLVYVGGWAVGVAVAGRTAASGPDFWRDLGVLLVRATAIAGGLAVLSGAIATLGKNTAAAMGIWFGYLIAVEAIVRTQLPQLVPWFLTPNVAALYGWESITQNDHTVTAGTGTLRLLVYAVVVVAGALVVFRRRDVA